MQIDHEIVVYVVYYVYTNIIYIYVYIRWPLCSTVRVGFWLH